MPHRLRIASCARLPEPDEDEAPLLAALAARGVEARMAAWDDPAEPWDEPIATVIRSTWNYIHRVDDFLAWADRAARAAPLWNPVDIVRANVHKSYLADLERRGHPIAPTIFVDRGATTDLPDADVVIKPTVSAASFGTRRFRAGERAAAAAYLRELAAQRDVMVQRYLPSVEDYGERALVWIDGSLTHAVRKAPRFAQQDETVGGAVAIAADERALAEAVLAPHAERLLYARVDVARDAAGRPVIMELELIEPSLFVVRHPPALARLADALARRL